MPEPLLHLCLLPGPRRRPGAGEQAALRRVATLVARAAPPEEVFAGTRDSLMSNSIRLYWVLREAGADVELLVSEGMWHGFNWEPALPEAVRARAAVYDFLRSRLSRVPGTG